MSKRKKGKAGKGVPITNAPVPARSTRLLSAVLLLALAALIGIVLAALESMKAATLA